MTLKNASSKLDKIQGDPVLSKINDP